MKYVLYRLLVIILCIFLLPASYAKDGIGKPVYVLRIDGAISPAYADYLKRGIERAARENAELVILELNTPGGLLTSTRKMVSDIIASKVPVAVYVSPSGGHAASAGTFILMAAHVAAMDEGTNVGAATPVKLSARTADKINDTSAQDDILRDKLKDMMRGFQDGNEESLKRKAIEDTTAFIRAIAEMRGRNGKWAQLAVTDAASLTAREALRENVIDLIATSQQSLLQQLNGRTVTMKNAETRTLDTTGVRLVPYNPDFMTKFLAFISDPNVAAILMMIGIYGLILEFYAPGTMVSGVTGVICLLLAFYAFSILPVTGLGGMLLLFGFLFVVGEVFLPSFGILGISGILALTIGLAVMFDGTELMGVTLEWQVIIGIALSVTIFMGIAFGIFVRSAIKKEISTGPESMIGTQAKVLEWEGHKGIVYISGERWNAFSPEGEDIFVPDQKVLISAVDDLKLKVRGLDS